MNMKGVEEKNGIGNNLSTEDIYFIQVTINTGLIPSLISVVFFV